MPKCVSLNKTTNKRCKSNAKRGDTLCARHFNQSVEKESNKKHSAKKESIKKQSMKKESIKKQSMKKDSIKKPEDSKNTLIEQKSPKQFFPKSILASSEEYNNLIERFEKWRNLTTSGYQFPLWVLNHFKKSRPDFNNYMNRARTYVLHPFHLEDVIKLIREREPNNIAGNQHYDKHTLKRFFGYSEGYYNRYYHATKKLAPNIAIYTPALFKLEPNNDLFEIHILHVIGLAFDFKEQVDFIHYSAIGFKKEAIFAHYLGVFQKIARCLKDYHLTSLALSAFGLGYFAKLYPNKIELYHIWVDAMKSAFIGNVRVKIQLMGVAKNIKSIIVEKMGIQWFGEDLGFFPSCVSQVSNLKTTLFINGWDPLSSVGNGCEGDLSLDGAMGSSTTIAVTGTGALNPLLLQPDRIISIL